MKLDALIAPDESQFAFTPRISSSPAFAGGEGATDFVTVPDAHLLFSGDFKRSGDDLKIVGDDGHSFLVSDYFKHDKKPPLVSPEGASLTSAVIEALAGPLAPGQYAQAGAPQSAGQAIGRVEKVEGNATVVRNGVTITLNAGDVVMKGDVAQTGAGGSLAIVFADGTAFNLAANARMVLNDFVYSAGGSNNSALISLVQGSISFVAGQVAKTGDMRVDTPVATMGIRGTAVLVEISANDGQTKFSVMVEPNGTTGSFNLYDKSSGALIGTVNSSNIGWVVSPVGPLQVIAQQIQKTPAELARELVIMQQVFQTFNSGPFDPNAPQQPPTDPNDPGRRGDNPQGTQTAQGTQFIPSGTNTITATFTQLNNPPGPNNSNNNPNDPSDPNTSGTSDPDDVPPPDDGPPPTTLTVNNIYGTAGNDNNIDNPWIEGTEGNDFVYAGEGDDIIIAAHGGGNDFYDGDGDNGQGFAGPGFDTIMFESANGVIFDLFGIEELNRAFSASTGLDNFINIERIVASPGNDVFNLHGGAWHINAGDGDDVFNLYGAFESDLDGGDGIDTIFFIGDLDITGNTDGPDVAAIEIIDLNTTGSNTVDLDIDGVLEAIEGNATGYLVVNGTAADHVNLTNEDNEIYPDGRWRLANEGDYLENGPGDGYVAYVFDNDGEIEAVVYIQDGIVVDGVYASATVEDRFNSQAYNLNDGSKDWATGWTEANDDFSGALNGSPTAGEIFISHDPTTSSGNLQLTLTDNDAEGDNADTIQRSVDLTGATSATLTFDYRRVDMENADDIQIYASNGGNFELIGEIEGNGLDDEAYQTFTFDLTPFISANTTIQFAVDDRLEDGDTLYIDNVKITYLAENQAPVISIDNAGTTPESGSTTLFDLSVSDADNGGDDIFHATVTSQFGKLSMADPDANAEDEDDSDYAMEFHATLDEINEALHHGITYTDPTEASSPLEKVTLTIKDMNGGTDTVNFIFNIFGEGGVELQGTNEKDVLFGTGNADNVTGGDGADSFVFAIGEVEIPGVTTDNFTDFDVSEDRIIFDGGTYDSIDDLEITYSQGNAIIDLGYSGYIILDGVDGSAGNALQASNFVFHPFTV